MDSGEDDALHPAIRGLKTVCRCNNIKYRTIERAIREGACTIAQVASRTTATTGHCGGSCTPDVQEMIDAVRPAASVVARCRPAEAGPHTPGPDAQWWVRKK